jgi:quercetin dioxygenase-like cupin family protein
MILKNAAARAEYFPEKPGKVGLALGEHLYAGLNCFLPGQEHQAHTHPDQDKLYVVLSGRGEAQVGGEVQEVEAGDVVLARAGVAHGLKNTSGEPLAVLVVFGPPPKGK